MWYFAQFGDGTRNGDSSTGEYQESQKVILPGFDRKSAQISVKTARFARNAPFDFICKSKNTALVLPAGQNSIQVEHLNLL